MSVSYIPEGYHTITPYVMVQGVTKLLTFISEAFDAVEIRKMELPDGSVNHAEYRIGDSIMMFSEATEEYPAMPGSFYLYVEDTDSVYTRALEAGGTSVMEPADQHYGDRNAGVKDASGNVWYIATHLEDLTADELARREKEKKKL